MSAVGLRGIGDGSDRAGYPAREGIGQQWPGRRRQLHLDGRARLGTGSPLSPRSHPLCRDGNQYGDPNKPAIQALYPSLSDYYQRASPTEPRLLLIGHAKSTKGSRRQDSLLEERGPSQFQVGPGRSAAGKECCRAPGSDRHKRQEHSCGPRCRAGRQR